MVESYPHLFSPLVIGSRTVRNRVVLTPHAHVISSLWASEEETNGHIGYWKSRADAGWVDGVSAHIANVLVPGFEPTGVGAATAGHFRTPFFVERVGRLAQTLHAQDTMLTVQMIHQGGMPHGPSATTSGPLVNNVSHALTAGEIDRFIEEYGFSAGKVADAGADGVEVHLNHDDLMEWFLSPKTNRRTDDYGGSLEGRMRFPLRALAAIRERIGPDAVLGVRLNLREEEPGGYDTQGGIAIAQALETSGLVDYLNCAIGTPWGNPSYIQPHFHQPAEWSHLAGMVREAVSLPVGYGGRVTSPQVAEQVLATGHADMVGMARAAIADGDLLRKAREGREEEIRPCVGGNECISRRLLEAVPFSCAVNPRAGRDHLPEPAPVAVGKRVLVIGAGPAGMEVAGVAAERGHSVEVWEAQDVVGGQLRIAAKAPTYGDYARFLDWQRARLERLGVLVRLRRRADADAVIRHDVDIVVVATGARPRRLDIPGANLDHVRTAAEVLDGAELSGHVVVISEDDHLPPLAVADHLATQGCQVTLVHPTPGPAPLVSRYLIGSALARLDEHDVTLRASEQAVEITPTNVRVRNVYTSRERLIENVDGVVFACGAVPENALHAELAARGCDAHLLGDAYAPRRLVWATRQAHDLAATL